MIRNQHKKQIEKIETKKIYIEESIYEEQLNPREVVAKINEIIERLNEKI